MYNIAKKRLTTCIFKVMNTYATAIVDKIFILNQIYTIHDRTKKINISNHN